MTHTCTLCSLELPKNAVREGENSFCCSGCLTVFQILGKHENFQEHPIFQEALKAGVIGNPELVYNEAQAIPLESAKCHLQIDGMWCPACAEGIRLILLRLKGVLKCVVDYATDLAVITYNPHLVAKEALVAKIGKLGYVASELFSPENRRVSRSLWLRFALATFCMLNIMMFSYPLYSAHFGTYTEGYELALGWLSFALSLPLITFAAWPIWKRLAMTMRSHLLGMETLVLIGVGTAFGVSTYNLLHHDPIHLYFDSMAMVLTFVLLGQILEKSAKFSAKETLLRLTRSLPKRGYKRLPSGDFAYVPLKDIRCGDILLVRTGEKIVCDAQVEEGGALVDESVMTGEAMPLRKNVGSQVVAGSILKQGSLTLRVTKDQTESLLGQIVSLIEHDLTHKTIADRIIDQITRYFIPAILAVACGAFWLGGPIRALTVLLISCPCALGIAAPLAQSRLLYRLAEKGALVRNRSRLALLARNPLFVFDKTGTLTEGKFRVLSGLETLSPTHTSLLKGMVSYSTHPIASTIAEALAAPSLPLDSISEIVGRGLEASHQGKDYLLGSERFMRERGVSVCSYAETVIYFAENQQVIAEIHLGDRIRSHLPRVEGVIISGDSHNLVAEMAKKCGFLWGKGGMDPLQKREEILRLKREGRCIAMVGDGINDALAMTAADVSISVVSATDLAVEVSDILLTTEHLDALPLFCRLAKKCQSLVRQNLFWAFSYNCVGVVLAFFGYLTPLMAASFMALSSLFVTLNSLRLKT